MAIVAFTVFLGFQSQIEFYNTKNIENFEHRSLQAGTFENVKIKVTPKNYFNKGKEFPENDDTEKIGKYYCRHTSISTFKEDDANYAGMSSILTNVFWFMSGNKNFLFQDYQEDSNQNQYNEYINKTDRQQSCKFTLDLEQQEKMQPEKKCYARGYQLDNEIDPVESDRCIQNYELIKENNKFDLFQLSCGTKQISKINGGNTYAKIKITPAAEGSTTRDWDLTNERDFLEDFYQDSNKFELEIEIPNNFQTEGPQSEIGCVVSKEKGYGYIARGPKTLKEPK